MWRRATAAALLGLLAVSVVLETASANLEDDNHGTHMRMSQVQGVTSRSSRSLKQTFGAFEGRATFPAAEDNLRLGPA